MSPQPSEIYERTMKMLKPALERVASDPEFRERLELNPLVALTEVNVELDEDTRRELEGRRFSEFWAARQQAAQGPAGVRDLPPEEGTLTDKDMEVVSGGVASRLSGLSWRFAETTPIKTLPGDAFAPPYVPVGPAGD